ncbi:MAG: IS200/IS605 family transposase [Bacteroidota bacterium]
MANTYTQLYIQIVFAVSRRECLIPKQHRDELHKYITGIVQKVHRDQKMLSVFCMPDHAHLLIGLRPSISISDLVRDIKAGSSQFINDNNWVKKKFKWQEGFGAFSYSGNSIDSVIKYILNQERHHEKKKFREEYLEILKEFEVEYDEKYLFKWID